MPPCRASTRLRRGQAMVESLIVLLFLVAAFLFLYDFAFGAVARLLLENGAASAARADAVGLNGFQREKSLRVGMIPVSGRRLVPGDGRAVAPGAGELALVRTYLQARDWAEADGILDYEGWRGLSHDVRRSGGTCRVRAAFETPTTLPRRLGALFGLGTAGPTRTLAAEWAVEDHASLYLAR